MIRALFTQRKVKENFQEKLNQLVPKLLVKKSWDQNLSNVICQSLKKKKKKKKNMSSFVKYFFIYIKGNTWLKKSGNNKKTENNRETLHMLKSPKLQIKKTRLTHFNMLHFTWKPVV